MKPSSDGSPGVRRRDRARLTAARLGEGGGAGIRNPDLHRLQARSTQSVAALLDTLVYQGWPEDEPATGRDTSRLKP